MKKERDEERGGGEEWRERGERGRRGIERKGEEMEKEEEDGDGE